VTANHAPARDLASSLQNISLQLARAIGPVVGGALFHAGYLVLPFLRGAALQVGDLVLYARFFGSREPRGSAKRSRLQWPDAV